MVNVYIQMYTEYLNGEILYPNLIWRVMSAKTFGWWIWCTLNIWMVIFYIQIFTFHIWMVNVYILMYTEHLNGEIFCLSEYEILC